MHTVFIDGTHATTRNTLHDMLAQQLAFPQWYGKNLDALFDCLTDVHERVHITVVHTQDMRVHLGDYTQAFVSLLRAVTQENSAVTYEVLD